MTVSLIIAVLAAGLSSADAQETVKKRSRHGVKPVEVSLATAETLAALNESHPADAAPSLVDQAVPASKFSQVFLYSALGMVLLVIATLFLNWGRVARRLPLSVKLAIGFGSLVAISALLGASGYLYLNHVQQAADLEKLFLDLDLMAKEIHVAQNNFLLQGRSSKEVQTGEAEKINILIKEYKADLAFLLKMPLDGVTLTDLGSVGQIIDAYEEHFRDAGEGAAGILSAAEQMTDLSVALQTQFEELMKYHESSINSMYSKAQVATETVDYGIVYNDFKQVALVRAAQAYFSQVENELKEFLLTNAPKQIPAMADSLGWVQGYLAKYRSNVRIPKEEAMIREVESKINGYGNAIRQLVVDTVTVNREVTAMVAALQQLPLLTTSMEGRAKTMAEAVRREARTSALAMLALNIAIGIFLTAIMTRTLSRPVDLAVAALTESAGQVDASAALLRTASTELSNNAGIQAAGLEETSASLGEITSIANANERRFISVQESASETQKVIGQANTAMDQLVEAIAAIDEASGKTAKIIKSIDGIAFQTNLLALNAAVEAARAGNMGAGFAVVADEVRSLAQKTSNASRETADLINETVARVHAGRGIVTDTRKIYGAVAANVHTVTTFVAELSLAAKEQALGIGQVNSAAASLDQLTQQLTSSADDTSRAAHDMTEASARMDGIVAGLRAVVRGGEPGRRIMQQNRQADNV